MFTRAARRALRAKRARRAKTISGIDVNDPWLTDDSPLTERIEMPVPITPLTFPEAVEKFAHLPELQAAIIARRDNQTDDHASALRAIAQDHESDGRITEAETWSLIALSEID